MHLRYYIYANFVFHFSSYILYPARVSGIYVFSFSDSWNCNCCSTLLSVMSTCLNMSRLIFRRLHSRLHRALLRQGNWSSRVDESRNEWNYVPSNADKGQPDFYRTNSQVAGQVLFRFSPLFPSRVEIANLRVQREIDMRACVRKKVRGVAYKCGLKCAFFQAPMVPFRTQEGFLRARFQQGSRRRPLVDAAFVEESRGRKPDLCRRIQNESKVLSTRCLR